MVQEEIWIYEEGEETEVNSRRIWKQVGRMISSDVRAATSQLFQFHVFNATAEVFSFSDVKQCQNAEAKAEVEAGHM